MFPEIKTVIAYRDWELTTRELLFGGEVGDRNGLYLGWDTDYSGTCIYQKLLKCIHLRSVYFTVCKFYPQKVFFYHLDML